jgi:uncharacterized protein (TIGR02266 family)
MNDPVVIPVRFVWYGLAVQSTTRALTAQDLEVRCVVPPVEGTPLSLRLYLPDGPPEQARAVVTAQLDHGFRARFESLSPSGTARVSKLLERVGLPRGSPGHDARVFPRRSTRLRVQFKGARDLLQHADSISAGGLFVPTERPYQVGEVLRLALELPDGQPPVQVAAEITRRVSPQEAADTRQRAGIGLQFVAGDDAFRERIDRCLASLPGGGTTGKVRVSQAAANPATS